MKVESTYDERACTLLPGGTTLGVVVTITEALKLVEVVVPSAPVTISVVTGTDDVNVVGTSIVLALALSVGLLSAREVAGSLVLVEREVKSNQRSSGL